jgi:hypothetical protein
MLLSASLSLAGMLVRNLTRRFVLGAFVLEKLLLRESLKLDSVLKTLIVIRQPNDTNYTTKVATHT